VTAKVAVTDPPFPPATVALDAWDPLRPPVPPTRVTVME
jgi:hypothetical protein